MMWQSKFQMEKDFEGFDFYEGRKDIQKSYENVWGFKYLSSQ